MASTPGGNFVTASTIASNQYDNNVSDYGAFSGVNIVAHINHVPIGSIMGISYTIHTEKQAQYVFGSQNPVNFVTGKRGIAGTIIFNQFDRNPLISAFTGANGAGQPMIDYASNFDPNSAFAPYATSGGNSAQPTIFGTFQKPGQFLLQQSVLGTNVNAAYKQALSNDIADAYNIAYKIPLEYADQLPAFDITLTMMNNKGQGAFMVYVGIDIINEGGGFTIDDMRSEVAYTYVARGIRPLSPILPNGQPASRGNAIASFTSNFAGG